MSHPDLCPARALRPWLRYLIPALLLVPDAAFSQCTLTCNDGLQIALDASGQALISTSLIAPDAADDCPGTLQLKLFTPQGVPIPGNTLNCSHVGLTVTAQVKHLASGNSCTGTLEVRDFLPPLLACPDKFVFCSQDPSPAAVGFPVITDNCTPANELTINYFDNQIDLPCGTYQNGQQVTGRIDRAWTATDAQGNSNDCLQRIWLKHVTHANVVFPPNFDGLLNPSLDCGQDPYDLAVTGQPTVEGVPFDNSPDCEFGVVYSDQLINICPPAGFSVIRTWTAIDFCSGQIVNRIQVIKVEDKTPPAIPPLADITVGTDGFSCTGTVEFPVVAATDDCSAVTLTPVWQYGSGFGPFAGVPEGIHTVTYKATDACNNTSTATMQVTVTDASPPSAICSANVQVSLSAGGAGYLNAGSIDAGSSDNCSQIVLAISRDDSTYLPILPFDCSDIGAPLPVSLRVTDESGLENFCTASVEVRDFLKPNLNCPAHITLSCLQDHTDLQITGMALAADNCTLQSIDFVDVANIDPCNIGSVSRVWMAKDAAGNTRTCTQQITLQAISTVTVVFPPDVSVNACPDSSATQPPATGQPSTGGQHCSPLSVTFTDQVFAGTTPASCRRILRHWKVIDFCIYDPNDNNTGIWQHTQVIDVTDDVPPVLVLPPDVTLNADQPACMAQAVFPDVFVNDCSDVSITHNGIFATAPGQNASGVYPLGTHQIVFTATDACGNSAQSTLRVSVQDLTPPTALCKSGVVLSIGATGTVALDAAAINAGSTDHCSAVAELSMSVAPTVFDCQKTGNQDVTLQVQDAAGNLSTCLTTVSVVDPGDFCQPDPVAFGLGGLIRTEKGVPVSEIPVLLQGDGFAAMAECDAAGTYIFEDVPAGGFYSLTPANNAKWLNGLTTFDLVLISKHILGLDTLDSPFKLIAADANRSGTVTTFDIVQFRKVILGISDTVPGNTSWRFVDAAHIFPDPEAPFDAVFPENITLGPLDTARTDLHFTGVKIGDLNNSTDAADPRTPTDTLCLKITNMEIRPGTATSMPVFIEKTTHLDGFQCELQIDTNLVSLRGLERGKELEPEHLALHPDGRVTISWNRNGLPGLADSLLLYLKVEAKSAPVRFSDVLRLKTDRIAPEAYTPEGLNVLALQITREQDALPSPGLGALPARPNPFSENTVIPFYMAQSGEIALYVSDLAGRPILYDKKTITAGWQEWRIDRSMIQSPGAYTYRLSGPDGGMTSGVLLVVEGDF